MLALDPINEALKNRGVKGRIVPAKDRLFLRGTFTTADGTRKDRRIPLGLPAHQGQLLEAESRVIALAGIIASTGIVPTVLPWQTVAPTFKTAENTAVLTVAEGCEQLEAQYWEGKVPTSAALRSWKRIETELNRIGVPNAELTPALLVAVASSTEPGSRSRQMSCQVLKRLGRVVGFDHEKLAEIDKLRTPYTPGVREIPTDDKLFEAVRRLRDHNKWGWCTAALAVYGCRPAEIFSMQPTDNGTARCLTVKRKGAPPEWRTAMALPIAMVDEFDLLTVDRPLTHESPTQYDSLDVKRINHSWGEWFVRQCPGWQLYDLRHAWAVRSIRESVPTGLASRCMGHDIGTHTKTYHRWLTEADVAAFVASRKN